MIMYFIRTKDEEGFIEANTLEEAFTELVKATPLENLGMVLLGHTEYFPRDAVPEECIACRTTIHLVKAGIITEEQAMDINESFMGERIV